MISIVLAVIIFGALIAFVKTRERKRGEALFANMDLSLLEAREEKKSKEKPTEEEVDETPKWRHRLLFGERLEECTKNFPGLLLWGALLLLVAGAIGSLTSWKTLGAILVQNWFYGLLCLFGIGSLLRTFWVEEKRKSVVTLISLVAMAAIVMTWGNAETMAKVESQAEQVAALWSTEHRKATTPVSTSSPSQLPSVPSRTEKKEEKTVMKVVVAPDTEEKKQIPILWWREGYDIGSYTHPYTVRGSKGEVTIEEPGGDAAFDAVIGQDRMVWFSSSREEPVTIYVSKSPS